MGAPRSTGLPWHLGYPIIMFALICAATWSSAASLHLAAANSLTTQVRFGPKDYCGFNVTVQDGVRYYDPLGCVDAGWSYQVDRQAVGIGLPGAVSTSLSKGAALLLVCKCDRDECYSRPHSPSDMVRTLKACPANPQALCS